jgi:hypothetical protein
MCKYVYTHIYMSYICVYIHYISIHICIFIYTHIRNAILYSFYAACTLGLIADEVSWLGQGKMDDGTYVHTHGCMIIGYNCLFMNIQRYYTL